MFQNSQPIPWLRLYESRTIEPERLIATPAGAM
jgi:hypothetical protein